MEAEKLILLAWVWCVVRLTIFNTYEIVFLPSFIILLDLTFTPSKGITPTEDDSGSSAIGVTAQEDKKITKKKINYIQGKEEREMNDMIAKLMYEEGEKAWNRMRKKITKI
ncbi:hypothetical protein NPIL_353191 [Nephila pilipes]|uniref:Uncharacterized protein n=1 Tax=Nephila pilipes TaxID=299642 RepID=A0A8X6UMG4_NEPPI|nr:hypothetical protein NPIL_353191 [Nephila pilipes]